VQQQNAILVLHQHGSQVEQAEFKKIFGKRHETTAPA
jgi:hypothetical protein